MHHQHSSQQEAEGDFTAAMNVGRGGPLAGQSVAGTEGLDLAAHSCQEGIRVERMHNPRQFRASGGGGCGVVVWRVVVVPFGSGWVDGTSWLIIHDLWEGQSSDNTKQARLEDLAAAQGRKKHGEMRAVFPSHLEDHSRQNRLMRGLSRWGGSSVNSAGSARVVMKQTFHFSWLLSHINGVINGWDSE